MLTDRGRGMLVAAVGAWLLSRILGVPELSMAALAMVALVILAVVYTATTSARLSVTRRVHPPRLFFDAKGSVELTLTNRSRLPTAIVQVEDRASPGVAGDTRFVLSPLPPYATATLRYPLHGRHRGRYELGPVLVRLRDPFGLASRRQHLAGRDEVVVYPPVWQLPAGVTLSGHTASGGGGKPRPLVSGEELANVREYVRGDDLRKVHWRTTAHRGKLMVRQQESPQNPQAVVVLDVRAEVHRSSGPLSTLEAAVMAAASATYHLAERAYAVKLLDRPIVAVPQPMPWELVLERLAVAEPERHVDLGALWQQLGQGVAGEGVLCAVMAVPEPGELRPIVRAGRAFTTRLAVLIDTHGAMGSRRGRTRSASGDTGATVEALRAAGWRVAVLAPGGRIDEAWRDLIRSKRGTPVPTPGAALR